MTQRPDITPGPPVSVVEAAAHVVEEQAEQLRRFGKRVRRKKEDDPEAVHQMRVATRRLRTALRTLRGHVAPPKKLNRALRWLAVELGAVRDHDVILALLRAPRLPGASREERSRLARLVAKVESKRDTARRALRAALKRQRYQDLLERLADFTRAPRPLDADQHLASRVLTQVVENLGAVLAESEGMTAAAPKPEALHVLRIMFKRLRYALDFHAAACGLAYDVERRMARAMQDALGEIHDRDLLLGWLHKGKGAFAGGWPALEARLQAERARLMRRFLRLRREWSRRTRPEATVAPLQAPRFAHLEVQPVTLRLVAGPRQVASSMIA